MADVVVVEDDPLTSRLVGEVISVLGYQVSLASSATEALNQVTRDTRTVLVDVNLRGESGLDLMAILSVSDETRHVPLIAMTGADEPETMAVLDQLGIVAVLPKPFDSAELALLVQVVLGTGPKSKRPPDGGPEPSK